MTIWPFIKKRFQAGVSTVHQVSLSCNVLPPERYGGIETVISNLTRGLVAAGVPVVCYAPGDFGIAGAEHFKTLDHAVPGPKQGVPVANTPRHLDRIADGIRGRYRPGDIVHFHHCEQYPAVKRMISKKCHLVETAHWTTTGMPNRIIYPSRALKKAVGRPGAVIPHGIDLERFQFETGNGSGPSYLFYAGRVTRDKGIHIGAEAAAEYGVEFRIAGPITDPDYFGSFAHKVEYLGELTGPQLRRQYSGALALVYMTQYIEPFGLAVVEAMACGCPVITTGLGGTGETVVENRTGFFCRNAADILRAMEYLHQIQSETCIDRASKYAVSAMTRGYIQFYNQCYA